MNARHSLPFVLSATQSKDAIVIGADCFSDVAQASPMKRIEMHDDSTYAT